MLDRLMSYYCSALAQSERRGGAVDYARALQDARLWVRKQEKWKHPFFWGTFVLIGD